MLLNLYLLTASRHLLGKKSWNVYNQDNIQKVKRDEAAAKAIEEAEEQRMQEIDAERRIQVLRGEIPTPLPDIEEKDDGTSESRSYRPARAHKIRKKAGENDTDFEMRIAHEQTSANSERQIVLRKTNDAPLTDQSGHIDLFPQEHSNKRVEKNPEAEKEAAKKKKEYEDQYTMRFSNAAGFKQSLEKPWYSKTDATEVEQPAKDNWGNDGPRRKERQASRIISNDPLALMRQGAAKVRQVEKEKKRWREEKDRELQELVEAEQIKRHKKRHDGEGGREDFRLERSKRLRDDDDGSEGRRRHKHRDSRRSSHRDDEDIKRHKHRHRGD
jgi:hypothetical protein